jgi:P27 family predicted phage terminase small subunit
VVVGATALAVPAVAPAVDAPGHLRPETSAWFRHVAETWVLEAHHRRVLQAAAEAWDQAQGAREALARDGLMISAADGSPRAHPMVAAATAARAQFASLIAQLELDDAGTPAGGPR